MLLLLLHLQLPSPAKPQLHLPHFFCSGHHCDTGYLRKPCLELRRHHHHHYQLTTHCSLPRLEAPSFDGELSRRGPAARPVSVVDDRDAEGGNDSLLSSARAVVAAIHRASSSSPVEFVQRMEKDVKGASARPSPDFLRLCLEQMGLFRMVVHRDVILSVYVRPAGSYVMDQLELHRITFYPEVDCAEIEDGVILIGNFGVPAGLRAAEAYFSDQQVTFLPEYGAIVLPMVKHPFVVGFIVAEFPFMEMETCRDDKQHLSCRDDEQRLSFGSSSREAYGSPRSDKRVWEIQNFEKKIAKTCHQFTAEQSGRAIMISRSLAMAYVMDQKALLLQQSSWQNNVRMSHLVEQIRGPLSNIRTLTKMLSVQLKKSEISSDIIADILVQGDHMKNTLQKLQDAVYLTKANIVRYNEETLKKVHDSACAHPELMRSLLPDHSSREVQDRAQQVDLVLTLGWGGKDVEIPMPPLALAPQQQNIRPCSFSDVLADLVRAAGPLVHKQKCLLKLNEHSQQLQVAVEESALRQALSNLIEGALLRTYIGGRVEIIATGAPAGGVLIVIDDDGPDMHYMTQAHSLTPFGADLFLDDMVEDNMTWNFVAGLTVSREILESYGCVVRVISPRSHDAALGTGGTRVELWLPTLASDPVDFSQEQL